MVHGGDKTRFRVFAEFIVRTFPNAVRIADVAGGHGSLSFHLLEAGRKPTVIDPRPAALPRRIHRILRKRSVRQGRLVAVERIVKDVSEADLGRFDLIVALHPDAATERVVRTAIALGKDFAVVPCCVFPLDGVRRSREDWVGYMASLAAGSTVTRLAMSGANLVVWRSASL